MTIEIIDKIENFKVEDFIQLEAIVNDRLWVNRSSLEEALEEYETDEDGVMNSETFLEYYNTTYVPMYAMFFAKAGDKIVAGGILQHWSLDRVMLIDFAVSLEHEGRGIASKMLDEVISYCKARNLVEIGLEVRCGMPAHNLYLKKGFEDIRLLEDDMVESDEICELEERGIEVPSQDCWYMELKL